MADIKLRALGLREVRFSDSQYYLTALAEDGRKIEIRCRDTRKRGGSAGRSGRSGQAGQAAQTMAVARPFAYIACVLAERGGKYTLREADLVHSFFPLSQDILSYALACYLAELISSVSQGDEPNPAFCRLLLGAFYALETRKQDAKLVKAAFEWRVLAESGYQPDLDTCGICREAFALPSSKAPADSANLADSANPIPPLSPPFFSVAAATVAHAHCVQRVGGSWTRLTNGTYQAIRSVLSRPPDHVYAFGLTGAARKQFCTLAEQYVLYRLEHSFDSLSFYHSLLQPVALPPSLVSRTRKGKPEAVIDATSEKGETDATGERMDRAQGESDNAQSGDTLDGAVGKETKRNANGNRENKEK